MNRKYNPIVLAAVLIATLALGGCGVYRINVQQGNWLDAETVGQIEPGMTRSQVKYLLGTPIVADPFHDNRWDYVYFFRHGKTGQTLNRRIVVHFKGDEVDYVEDVANLLNKPSEESAG